MQFGCGQKHHIPCLSMIMNKYVLTDDCTISTSVVGFMAERFVKPPVLLQLMFPCTFRLKAIVIENTIGSFTSSGLQVGNS